MSKLLFVDRELEGKRTFRFLKFSEAKSDFVVLSYERRGDDVQESEITVPEFLSHAASEEAQAFYEAISVALSIEILPSLRIVGAE